MSVNEFSAYKLVISLDKTKLMKFVTDNLPLYALSSVYNGRYFEGSANTTFRGLQIDNHLNWKNNTDQMILK
jgi:hypothetical protein